VRWRGAQARLVSTVHRVPGPALFVLGTIDRSIFLPYHDQRLSSRSLRPAIGRDDCSIVVLLHGRYLSLDYPFASRVTSVSYSSTPKSSVDSMSYAIDANMPAASSDYSIDATAYGSISDFGTCFPPPSFPNSGSSTSILPAMEDYSDFDDTTDASATVAATAAVSATSSSSHTVRRRNTYTAMPTSLAPYAEEPLASTRTRAGTMLTGSSAAVRLTEAMPISNTLAAIKAQAFGGVRKTRARVKRVPTSSDAARAAVEILEARGIGLGLDIAGGVKRRKRGDHP